MGFPEALAFGPHLGDIDLGELFVATTRVSEVVGASAATDDRTKQEPDEESTDGELTKDDASWTAVVSLRSARAD